MQGQEGSRAPPALGALPELRELGSAAPAGPTTRGGPGEGGGRAESQQRAGAAAKLGAARSEGPVPAGTAGGGVLAAATMAACRDVLLVAPGVDAGGCWGLGGAEPQEGAGGHALAEVGEGAPQQALVVLLPCRCSQ